MVPREEGQPPYVHYALSIKGGDVALDVFKRALTLLEQNNGEFEELVAQLATQGSAGSTTFIA